MSQQASWSGFGFSRPRQPLSADDTPTELVSPIVGLGEPDAMDADNSAEMPTSTNDIGVVQIQQPLQQQHHQQQPQHQQAIPPKSIANSTPVPVVESQLHCDACEKDFPHDRGYQQHLKSHVKCNDCAFVAIPKIVAEHKQLLHATAKQWPYDASDVQKWRDARKKNYPTDKNMHKRQLIEADREHRGQVATLPKFRVGHPFPKGKNKRRKVENNLDTTTASISTTPTSTPTPTPTTATPTPTPTPTLTAVTSTSVSTSTTTTTNQKSTKLMSLVAYSDSESETESMTHQPPQDSTDSTETSQVVHQLPRGADETRVEPPVGPIETIEPSKSEQSGKEVHTDLFDPVKTLKPKRNQKKNSLLERLLAEDVKQERNTVLQCIRHIVRQDFFGMA